VLYYLISNININTYIHLQAAHRTDCSIQSCADHWAQFTFLLGLRQ